MVKTKSIILLTVVILILTTIILLLMGRNFLGAAESIGLWTDASTPNTSQYLLDPYTATHIIHGLGFFLLIWIFARKLPWPYKFLLAVSLEAGWEIIENTNFIIDIYRTHTISLDYYGDSILNSLTDIFAMTVGFIAASKLRVWMSILLFIALEALLLFFIRDNLTINVIMLLHPFEAIKAWQLAL